MHARCPPEGFYRRCINQSGCHLRPLAVESDGDAIIGARDAADRRVQTRTPMNYETLPPIRELRTDGDIVAAFPVMSMLRSRITRDTFVAEVRRQQLQGYELIGAFVGNELVALAGVRRTHTLSRG